MAENPEDLNRRLGFFRQLDLSWGTLGPGEAPIPGSSRAAAYPELLTDEALRLTAALEESWHPHRKLWEWLFIMSGARAQGVVRPGAVALGFGVGREPLPSWLAAHGMSVIATDQPESETSEAWAASGQHSTQLQDLHKEPILPSEVFYARVGYRAVDMNELPADLPKSDLIWSSCTIEHLGSPEAGLDFVLKTLDLLEPGGLSIHTTELDLIRRPHSLELGHCALYQMADLVALQAEVLRRGCRMVLDTRIPLGTVEDRFLALPPYPATDPHFKLQIGPTVTTSFGLAITRPR